MLDRFKDHMAQTFPFLAGSKILVACSGGVDSMVLAHLVQECGYDFSLAHCNYKLRGKASDLDEEWVKKWALDNERPLFLETFDLSREEASIQLKARDLRYHWFKELSETDGFGYVLTAHHANDTLETFFINLSRGTGLDGLTGIPQINLNIIRPLLPFTKEDILGYAKSHGIRWREDESNTEVKYVRNKIRHQLVPKLVDIHPSFLSNFQKTQEYLGLAGQMLDAYGKELKARLFVPSGTSIRISIAELKKYQPLTGYLFLLFKSYGFTQWPDITDVLEAQSGKEIRSKSHRLIKHGENLILAPLNEQIFQEYVLDEAVSEWNVPIHLRIESVETLEIGASNSIYVDKEKLNYPLKLRKWKIGDYFYPLGMNGRKKLSKYFKDKKYSSIQKEEQWLLCSDVHIIWVLGERMDDRFKVDPQTKEILKISWLI